MYVCMYKQTKYNSIDQRIIKIATLGLISLSLSLSVCPNLFLSNNKQTDESG